MLNVCNALGLIRAEHRHPPWILKTVMLPWLKLGSPRAKKAADLLLLRAHIPAPDSVLGEPWFSQPQSHRTAEPQGRRKQCWRQISLSLPMILSRWEGSSCISDQFFLKPLSFQWHKLSLLPPGLKEYNQEDCIFSPPASQVSIASSPKLT